MQRVGDQESIFAQAVLSQRTAGNATEASQQGVAARASETTGNIMDEQQAVEEISNQAAEPAAVSVQPGDGYPNPVQTFGRRITART